MFPWLRLGSYSLSLRVAAIDPYFSFPCFVNPCFCTRLASSTIAPSALSGFPSPPPPPPHPTPCQRGPWDQQRHSTSPHPTPRGPLDPTGPCHPTPPHLPRGFAASPMRPTERPNDFAAGPIGPTGPPNGMRNRHHVCSVPSCVVGAFERRAS